MSLLYRGGRGGGGAGISPAIEARESAESVRGQENGGTGSDGKRGNGFGIGKWRLRLVWRERRDGSHGQEVPRHQSAGNRRNGIGEADHRQHPREWAEGYLPPELVGATGSPSANPPSREPGPTPIDRIPMEKIRIWAWTFTRLESRDRARISTGESFRLDLEGWDAHLLRWGSPDPDAGRVLLLHGGAGHAHVWGHLAGRLSDRFTVVALDQRGHGESGPTDRYGSKVLADDVGRVLDALGWPTASLVGHSMGGQAAYLFATAHPDRVERLVVIDTGPEADPAGITRIRANLAGPDSFATFDDALAEGRRWFPGADETLLRHRVEHNLVTRRTARSPGGQPPAYTTATPPARTTPTTSDGPVGGSCGSRR